MEGKASNKKVKGVRCRRDQVNIMPDGMQAETNIIVVEIRPPSLLRH